MYDNAMNQTKIEKKIMMVSRKIIGALLIIAGVVGGLYVGGWLMFVQPIMETCRAFDAGTLTGVMVGTTIFKCVLASPVGSVIAYIGVVLGTIIGEY